MRTLLLSGDACLVAGFQCLAVYGEFTANHENIAVASGSKPVRNHLVYSEERSVNPGVLVDLNRVLRTVSVSCRHGNREQLAFPVFAGIMLLLPRRRELRYGRLQPKLYQVRGL